MKTIMERVTSYLAKMPAAIQGRGGHIATFNASVVLVRGFGLSEADAWPCLVAWNQSHCNPPWKFAELRGKLRSAVSSTRPLGYLLNDHDIAIPESDNESEKKARQRGDWPAFRTPSKSEIEIISKLRGLPGSALWAAAEAHMLRMCSYEGKPCFVLSEGDFAQIRCLDGAPLRVQAGVSKAKNLPGSVGAFLGESLLDDTSKVLLVEGCIGLLEALGCISLADVHGWTAIAATSASSRFQRSPDLLDRLRGRVVRIVPDADKAGLDAASTWLADLDHVGAIATAIELPPECKDLGPIVSDPMNFHPFLTALFL